MRSSGRELGPAGRPRWKKALRVTPWRPRVYARKTCIFCAKDLRRGHYIFIGEAVVSGRHLPHGGLLCLKHTEIHLAAPCSCGEALYRLSGPRVIRGRIVDGVEYVTRTGDVVRECPGCRRNLNALALETPDEADPSHSG